MSDSRIPSQWQLQDTGEANDQWMLRDNEQRLPGHLQLQPGADYTPPNSGWQPLDYRAVQQARAPRRRGGWFLGALLTLIIVGVLAYVAARTFGIPDEIASLLPAWLVESTVPAAETPSLADGAAATPAADAAADPSVAPIVALTGTTTLTETAPLADGAGEEAAAAAGEPAAGSASDTRAGVSGEPGAAAEAPAEVPTPTPAPTPLPTPEPVAIRTATVSSGAGVNLRRNPQNDAELIRTLPDNASYVVASGPITGTDGTAWVQLALTDTLGYVAAGYATVVTRTVPYSEAVALLTSVGLAPPAPPAPPAEAIAAADEAAAPAVDAEAAEAAPGDAEAANAGTAEATGSADGAEGEATLEAPIVMPTATPRGIAARPRATATPAPARTPAAAATAIPATPITLTAVISTANGLNLRSQPQTGDNLVDMLTNATVVTVIGRVEGDQWVRVRTADGQEGYLSVAFLAINGVLTDLAPAPGSAPVGGGLQLPTPTPRASDASAATPVPAPAVQPAPAATAAADTGSGLISGGPGTLTVSNVSGVNVRRSPGGNEFLAALSWNATARALGRTADSQWIYVQLNDGTTGWVAAQAVQVADGMAALTVLQ